MIEIEREPEECVSAIVESEHTHFVVYLRRADGREVPINVASTDEAIELVRSMNPERISIRVVEGEARAAMLNAFHTYDVDDASEQQTQQRRTLH
jgi:hypothetical protein